MGDFPAIPEDFASDSSFAVSAVFASHIEASSRRVLLRGVFRSRSELPIFCNPFALFFAVWILMLVCLSFHISYAIYPGLVTPVLIFVVSSVSLLLGFFAFTAILDPDVHQSEPTSFVLDVTSLRRMNLLFFALALPIIVLNWHLSGSPPAIGDPTAYLTYGKLEQLLFPLLTCVAVNATLDPSRLRRYGFIVFALGVLALYIARGIMLVAFLQMFFLASLRSRATARKQLWLALSAVAVAVAGMTVIGNLRTAHDVFIVFLQIRPQFSEWPMAFLWFVSYISIPFSNLCWMTAHGSFHAHTLAFLYPLLPSFMAPSDPYTSVYSGMNIIDGASTYLQTWTLDFSYLGIYFANLLIGAGCGWILRRAFPKNILVLAIFLTSISLLFFSDMFFLLSTVVQVFLQVLVQKRCFHWQEPVQAFGSHYADALP
jgi:hypothetical protein